MLGILSDAHGNYYAFLSALDVLRNNGAEEIMFLGDAVGYIPSIKVVRHLKVMERLKFCIQGNHEKMLLRQDFNVKQDLIYQLVYTKSLMTKEDIEYIEKWKINCIIDKPVGRLMFVHGSPNEPTDGYVYPDSDLSRYKTNADFVFMGNSHYPFIREYKKTTYINVGSCGLPRDDGRFGSVAIFDPDTAEAKIIRFDIRDSTKRTLEELPNIHNSVKEIFSRQKDKIFGELYGG